MEARLSLVTLGVADVARARAFYEAGLGLPLKHEFSDEHVAFFALHGLWLGLFSRQALADDAGVPCTPAGQFSGVTLAHNVPTREAVHEVLDQAIAAGARLVKPAQDTFWGGYSGYFSDPDGHLWEVAWNPHFWIE